MGWDSFSVWRKSCTLMWKECLICFYSAWRCISTSPVSITASSFQLSKFEKIRLPKSLFVFFAFKCGVLWNKAFLMVKNPLRRAYFLGAISGVGCWIQVNMQTPLGSRPHSSVRWWCPGSTTLSVLCFWCFSRTSLESCQNFGVLHGMISIPLMSFQKLPKQGLLLMAACTYFFRSGHLEGMDWILPLDRVLSECSMLSLDRGLQYAMYLKLGLSCVAFV